MKYNEDYKSLDLQYRDANSLMYKKMSIVGQYIHNWDEEITQL